MTKTIGRPMKYKRFLVILEDDRIYTPAAIVRNGEKNGLIDQTLKKEDRQLAKLRVRHSLARLSVNHYFPKEGDGYISIKGQAPARGWKGERWKEILEYHE